MDTVQLKMKPVDDSDIMLPGEIAARSIKNSARVHNRCYRPAIVGTSGAESPGRPGDWEGRTILALTLQAQSLKVRPAFLSTNSSRRDTGGSRGDAWNTIAGRRTNPFA